MYMYVCVYMYSTCIMIFTVLYNDIFNRLACTVLCNCYVHVHVCTCTCVLQSTFPPSHYMYSNLNIIVRIC